MPKIDLTKELKHLYNPPIKSPVRVDVPPMNYLMIDGAGNPNTAPAFAAGVEALFSLAYTLKFGKCPVNVGAEQFNGFVPESAGGL